MYFHIKGTKYYLVEQSGSNLLQALNPSKRWGIVVALLIVFLTIDLVKASPNVKTTNIVAISELDRVKKIAVFLERRVKENPQDIIAFNRLANLYLQRWRKNRDSVDLDRALRAAQASLKVVPAEQNSDALAVIALTELETHQFISAREHGRQLVEIDNNQISHYLILNDALVELGFYEKADAALFEAEKQVLHSKIGDVVSIDFRLAHKAMLHGEVKEANKHYNNALTLILKMNPEPEDTISWCYWKLGEIAFSYGHYEKAEKHYQSSLLVNPKFVPALESLGNVRAARGDLQAAILLYEKAASITADLDLLSMLGDIYQLSGRGDEAEKQHIRAERIGRKAGAIEHRNLAMFFANHNIHLQEAYSMASRDYDLRPGIYAADVLAWTALKAGDLKRAESAIVEAFRLNTQDARFFYHAGMIALAADKRTEAHTFLTKALQLNPGFDLLQASVASKTLDQLIVE